MLRPAISSDSDVTLVMAPPAGDSPRQPNPQDPPSAGDAAASTDTVMGDDEVEESATKKPRTESGGCFAQGLSDMHAASSTDSQSQGCSAQASPPPPPPMQPSTSWSGPLKRCPGCFRQYGASPCFYSGGTAPWVYPKARGKWCWDCFTVWRTRGFNQDVSLNNLEHWLDAHTWHRKRFDDAFWAHIHEKNYEVEVARDAAPGRA